MTVVLGIAVLALVEFLIENVVMDCWAFVANVADTCAFDRCKDQK